MHSCSNLFLEKIKFMTCDSEYEVMAIWFPKI